MYSLDALDGRIVLLFATEPRIGVLEASRRLGVARGTVQARLDRLESAGVITGWAPSVDPVALGFPVSAFATLEIAQGAGVAGVGHEPVASHLRTIPEVLEAHTITGGADMMVRLVARSNADLQRVIDLVVAAPEVARASTVIVLATEIPPRVMPLVESATPL
jgi:DNA-binding Lrp family transcriptional regulator